MTPASLLRYVECDDFGPVTQLQPFVQYLGLYSVEAAKMLVHLLRNGRP